MILNRCNTFFFLGHVAQKQVRVNKPSTIININEHYKVVSFFLSYIHRLSFPFSYSLYINMLLFYFIVCLQFFVFNKTYALKTYLTVFIDPKIHVISERKK